MIRTLVTIVLLGAAALAADRPRDDALARDVDAFLRDAPAHRWSVAAFPPADGGIFGLVGIAVDAWLPKLKGDISALPPVPGEVVTVDDDQAVFSVSASINVGRWGGRLLGFTSSFDGDTPFQTSTVKMDDVLALLTFRLFKARWINLAVAGGVSYWNVEADFTDTVNFPLKFTRSDSATLAGFGVVADVGFGPLYGYLLVAGFWAVGGDSGSSVHSELGVGFRFLRLVSLRVGYRNVALDLDTGSLDVDKATLDGIFIGLTANF